MTAVTSVTKVTGTEIVGYIIRVLRADTIIQARIRSIANEFVASGA